MTTKLYLKKRKGKNALSDIIKASMATTLKTGYYKEEHYPGLHFISR